MSPLTKLREALVRAGWIEKLIPKGEIEYNCLVPPPPPPKGAIREIEAVRYDVDNPLRMFLNDVVNDVEFFKPKLYQGTLASTHGRASRTAKYRGLLAQETDRVLLEAEQRNRVDTAADDAAQKRIEGLTRFISVEDLPE
jgi:hypothetical protein